MTVPQRSTEFNMHRAWVTIVSLAVALAAPTTWATPLISEVLYDAVGSDNGLSFVEIYGTPGTLLDGYVLEGINGANGAVTRPWPT